MSVPGGVLGIALCMHANQWLRCTGGMMIDSYCHEDRCVAIPDLYMALTHCCKMSLYTAHETVFPRICRELAVRRSCNCVEFERVMTDLDDLPMYFCSFECYVFSQRISIVPSAPENAFHHGLLTTSKQGVFTSNADTVEVWFQGNLWWHQVCR